MNLKMNRLRPSHLKREDQAGHLNQVFKIYTYWNIKIKMFITTLSCCTQIPKRIKCCFILVSFKNIKEIFFLTFIIFYMAFFFISESERKRRPKKTGRLWEFIRNLLLDPKTCPSLLRWEDAHAGIFRIVQSDAIANKWGMRKNNEKMNYEKLSRAMR